jgi:hypothetical protein
MTRPSLGGNIADGDFNFQALNVSAFLNFPKSKDKKTFFCDILNIQASYSPLAI